MHTKEQAKCYGNWAIDNIYVFSYSKKEDKDIPLERSEWAALVFECKACSFMV